MINSGPMRVGLAGCGYIGDRVHLPILTRLQEADVLAVCDADARRAEATARRFRVPRWYTRVGEMTDRERLQLVDICTPAHTHAGAIIEALEGNAHCLVEKPLATATADADRAIRLAQEHGRALFVIHNISHLLPSVQRAKAMVASGAVGRLIGVDVKYLVPVEERHLDPNHWLHRLPGDVVAEVMPHMLMLLLEFLDGISGVKVTAAKLSSHQCITVDEMRVLLEAENGLGTLTISFNSPSRRTTLDIIGSRVSLHVDADSQAIVTFPPHPGSEHVPYRGWRALREILQRSASLTWTAANLIAGRYSALSYGHKHLIRRALLAARGDAEYPIDIQRCREVVRVGEMICEQMEPVAAPVERLR